MSITSCQLVELCYGSITSKLLPIEETSIVSLPQIKTFTGILAQFMMPSQPLRTMLRFLGVPSFKTIRVLVEEAKG
jgi:hypothetical protein